MADLGRKAEIEIDQGNKISPDASSSSKPLTLNAPSDRNWSACSRAAEITGSPASLACRVVAGPSETRHPCRRLACETEFTEDGVSRLGSRGRRRCAVLGPQQGRLRWRLAIWWPGVGKVGRRGLHSFGICRKARSADAPSIRAREDPKHAPGATHAVVHRLLQHLLDMYPRKRDREKRQRRYRISATSQPWILPNRRPTPGCFTCS